MAILDVVRGLGDFPAAVVGFARGLVEAAVLSGLGAIAIYVQGYDFSILGIDGAIAMFVVPVILLGIRTLEGIADQIDQSK